MNLMKLIIDNIYFIWITLFIIICFFIQTYYEIENYENDKDELKSQVNKNKDDINDLDAITMVHELRANVDELKNDMEKDIKANSKDIKANSTLINNLKTTLEEYKKQLIKAMTPT